MNKQVATGLLIATLSLGSTAAGLGEQVSAMSEAGRQKFIGVIVRQSGAQCPAVKRTFFQGVLPDRSAIWNIGCNSRDNYGIVFADDAANSTRVVKCSEVKALAGAECFRKF
ncbi:MAG: hypothetical protein EON54_06945 [Alcaligenaceae bacterium]|nr:MAG: hypothetical protein EON54_06945 [Alcaligenaceae bacterium]